MFRKIDATVLLVEDLDKCTTFYRDTIGLPVTFSDNVSIGFRTEGQDFLLLKRSSAAQQISPEAVALRAGAGHQVFFCTGVDDVDAVYQTLTAKGVAFIKPPIDQAWGRRTTYFADPEGNLWEIFQILDA